MKFNNLIIIILIVFFKTGNVLSENNLFNVNNIELENKGNKSNSELANLAIKKGFKELAKKILLEEDSKKLSRLEFSEIKELVSYYQVLTKKKTGENKNKVNFNIFFDKDKLHNLFYKKEISYSEIIDKDLFILPIFKKDDQIFIYNKNFFYQKWNEIYKDELIDFVLPLENIEIIQKINSNSKNLLNLKLSNLFKEYTNKNLALVLIEETNSYEEKIYFRIKILEKIIVKNITVKKQNMEQEKFYEKIITEVKKEIINIFKSQNLIDIRTPSFLNVQLITNKNNNLAELNKRLKKIDLVENIYVQEFNNEFVYLKIKYLGKLNKIIKELEEKKIILKLLGDQWSLSII